VLNFVLTVWLLLAQQTVPSQSTETGGPGKPPVQDKRTELNLLGVTDSAAGESRRNENVQFNLIDNNSLKYLNIRLGTNATIITEFQPARKYFGTEFGNPPGPLLHLNPVQHSHDFHGGISLTRADSIFSARSFFQAGGV